MKGRKVGNKGRREAVGSEPQCVIKHWGCGNGVGAIIDCYAVKKDSKADLHHEESLCQSESVKYCIK